VGHFLLPVYRPDLVQRPDRGGEPSVDAEYLIRERKEISSRLTRSLGENLAHEVKRYLLYRQ
jgi:hypothetical protein